VNDLPNADGEARLLHHIGGAFFVWDVHLGMGL